MLLKCGVGEDSWRVPWTARRSEERRVGKEWKQWLTLFWGAPKSLQMVTAAMKLKELAPQKKSYDKPRQRINKQRHCLLTKVRLVKALVFLVVMYGCENWTIKKSEH